MNMKKRILFAFSIPALLSTAMAAEQPNVLLIFSDQLQRDVLKKFEDAGRPKGKLTELGPANLVNNQ